MAMVLKIVVLILLAAVAWVDHKTMEIPDELNLALTICGFLSVFTEPELSVVARIVGALCVSIPMYLVIRLVPGAFGGGDVKLTFAMGIYLGWKMVLVGTFLAFLAGGIQAVKLLVSGKAKVGEGAHMAFGPALCLGFSLASLCGNELLGWYLSLFY